MAYVRGANGQCALLEMCFLLHFTCTKMFGEYFSYVVKYVDVPLMFFLVQNLNLPW